MRGRDTVLRPSGWLAGSALVLVVLAVVARPWLVRSMTAHMFVHIPLLGAAGALLAMALRQKVAASPAHSHWRSVAGTLAGFNQFGVTAWLLVMLTSMYWMVPKALDGVLLSVGAELGKVLSVTFAGFCAVHAWVRSERVVKLFFVGGICWASAIVGMLYQESAARLCNFYLLDDQVWAGRGLVILALGIPLAWLLAEWLEHRRQSGRGS